MINDIIADITECVQIDFKGLCEISTSRINDGLTDVVRQVSQERSFTPVTYAGRNLGFIIYQDEITVNRGLSGITVATFVFICDKYGVHKDVLNAFSSYNVDNLTLSLESKSIYERYFETNENKPFQNFAFEIKVSIRIDFSCKVCEINSCD
jgi:hypothetical protein